MRILDNLDALAAMTGEELGLSDWLEIDQSRVDQFADATGDSPIGVTVPAVVIHGTVLSAANIDKSWIGVDADALLTKRLDRPVHVLNDADAAGLAGCGDHGRAFLAIAGQRLFTQDVQAAFQCGDGDGGMQEGGDGHADGVQSVQFQQVFPSGKSVRDGVFGLEPGQELGLHACHGNNFNPVHLAKSLDVLLAGPANTHHANLQGRSPVQTRFTHGMPFLVSYRKAERQSW